MKVFVLMSNLSKRYCWFFFFLLKFQFLGKIYGLTPLETP